jgi:DUF4097 and DUF4098 domain-containing protein YvlB
MRPSTAFALSFLLTASAFAARLEERFDKTFDVQPGTSFTLSTMNGHISVRGTDESRVHVMAVKRVRAESEAEAREVMNALEIRVNAGNGTLDVSSDVPRDLRDIDAGVNFEVTVPRSMNVALRTSNGAIELADVSGDLSTRTTNGRIRVSGASGTLNTSTTNGSIDAQLVSVTGGKPMTFSTTNGAISLDVPQSIAADVDASTTNGTIHSDLPVTTRSVERNALSGAVNGGGAELRLKTTNGSITIRTR